ncbi:hypothetical protein BOS5A_211167 [Bosea sp. EC-HK365B]|nr:hypothetical protein BOSE21B_50524 [Bosea sp. 21B]CAD5300894.1 hypothetical protein BOSE7B_90168 [Bosea sp. 7B]VVT60376.1 hypothetical protein BOS5A_211167 [Bosea sp. EC-HK365B]VXB59136.1 hypothetical protein BOSE127_140111 [Bosea sp. 127]
MRRNHSKGMSEPNECYDSYTDM